MKLLTLLSFAALAWASWGQDTNAVFSDDLETPPPCPVFRPSFGPATPPQGYSAPCEHVGPLQDRNWLELSSPRSLRLCDFIPLPDLPGAASGMARSILTRLRDRIQFAKALLPWGEARARECIQPILDRARNEAPRQKGLGPEGCGAFGRSLRCASGDRALGYAPLRAPRHRAKLPQQTVFYPGVWSVSGPLHQPPALRPWPSGAGTPPPTPPQPRSCTRIAQFLPHRRQCNSRNSFHANNSPIHLPAHGAILLHARFSTRTSPSSCPSFPSVQTRARSIKVN
jgi:hypothetical protein